MPTENVEVYQDGVLIDTETVEVTQAAVNRRAQTDRALAAITDLRQLKGTTGSLNLAQVSNAVRLFATVLLVLVRRAYGRVDEDD